MSNQEYRLCTALEGCTQRYRILWYRVALVGLCSTALLTAHCPRVLGQGLLGTRYAAVSFLMSRPNDDLLQEINDWAYGVNVITNFPITETLDINVDLSNGWFDGETMVGTTPVRFDSDITGFSAKVNKHFIPGGVVDPFAGIGIGYAKATIETSVGSTSLFGTDDNTFVDFVAGFEWKATDQFTIRPQISSGDSLDDFDIEEVIKDNLYLETQFIRWWNENWFTGFVIGSDFDDTEVGLGFFLGYGAW